MIEIYLITNHNNGKVYVGQTCSGIDFRWRHHVWESKKPKQPLHRAIAKYGIEAFSKEVLAVALTQEEANWYEIYFIQQYNSLVPNNKGYNVAAGGFGGYAQAGYSPEQKIAYNTKMSILLSGSNNPMYGKPGVWTGRRHSEATKAKMSANAIGKPGTTTGRKHTEETKAKISASNKKRTKQAWTGRKHSVATKLKMSISSKKQGANRQLQNEQGH